MQCIPIAAPDVHEPPDSILVVLSWKLAQAAGGREARGSGSSMLNDWSTSQAVM